MKVTVEFGMVKQQVQHMDMAVIWYKQRIVKN